jgi:hypothetical protein
MFQERVEYTVEIEIIILKNMPVPSYDLHGNYCIS